MSSYLGAVRRFAWRAFSVLSEFSWSSCFENWIACLLSLLLVLTLILFGCHSGLIKYKHPIHAQATEIVLKVLLHIVLDVPDFAVRAPFLVRYCDVSP